MKKYATIVWLVIIIGAFCIGYFSVHNTAQKNASATCIKNKDQAMKILLEADKDGAISETATAQYVKEVEARGNKVFFDETPDWVGDSPSFNTIAIGEELENGSKLLHSQYSYKLYACDIDLDEEDIDLPEKQIRFQFDFLDSDGKEAKFVDETKSCSDYYDLATEQADFDGDGRNEILADCFSGGTSNLRILYFYKLNGKQLINTGRIGTERKREIKDCNTDGIKDLVSYADNIPYPDENSGNATWKTSIYCNHWDKQNNKFIETKIAEE